MPDLADLFPGFESHWITAPAGRIFARSGGSGEPLLLLHGFPETHVMWHRLAPSLARTHKVVCMDLRGYGWSGAPHADPLHETYSKRAMGEDVLAVLDHFGWVRAAMVGHDRGARVAYRLALDHPGRVTRLAVIDIVPTAAMWGIIAQSHGVIAPHWTWMSDPAPAPENRIKVKPAALIDDLMASWTASKDLSAFDGRAVAHYRAFVQDPSRITAMCEDYRAGATLDREADDVDRAAGRTITCPVLALWGDVGVPSASPDPLGLWKPYAPGITGRSIVGGHFLPEENPQDTGAALAAFLAA
ncbi:MAG: alpha/beta hydrolase [Methylocystis sp.]|nr:alpha/beta hydrolase [Methylocystis sp.]MCA3582320.1 alpha/beta hydrolase [Methylocystis sp.]MCA3588215.1 alpha/beta hydrolase [Methylocystis sp.]MCA3590133.1 alpha/beta hydrolase [Methylocystis sp.]